MLAYSIGHEILLLNQRNPLLFDLESFNALGLNLRKASIIQAALVCSRTWLQSQRPERNLLLWGSLIQKSDWDAQIARWRAYRDAGTNSPPAPTQEAYEIANGLQNEDKGRELGGSYLARALAFCCKHHAALGYDTAYDVPFGLCNHLFLGELEMAGNSRIENQRELEERENWDKMQREIAEERKAACPR